MALHGRYSKSWHKAKSYMLHADAVSRKGNDRRLFFTFLIPSYLEQGRMVFALIFLLFAALIVWSRGWDGATFGKHYSCPWRKMVIFDELVSFLSVVWSSLRSMNVLYCTCSVHVERYIVLLYFPPLSSYPSYLDCPERNAQSWYLQMRHRSENPSSSTYEKYLHLGFMSVGTCSSF